ncbi:hypothetical protein BaRGS_00007634 [Batillaria attramentaria]|uniref:Uncharacterized protein n=1 Tax=Batillaria attramentaria TaxID=370345 RepID=A0ABD0LNV2_9CAEN
MLIRGTRRVENQGEEMAVARRASLPLNGKFKQVEHWLLSPSNPLTAACRGLWWSLPIDPQGGHCEQHVHLTQRVTSPIIQPEKLPSQSTLFEAAHTRLERLQTARRIDGPSAPPRNADLSRGNV